MTTPTTPESQSEEIELKFASVYKSPEWQQLNEIDRAQLMLVAEGVKPGTTIGGDFTNFPKILDQLGLTSTLDTNPLLLEPGYTVAKPEVLSQYLREILSAPENADYTIFHKIVGKFLGYPECCTEEYCNPQRNLQERGKKSPSKFLSNVDYEQTLEIDNTGTYPQELDYLPPSFTPCSAHCEAALKQLNQWMRVIKTGDPKAARELQLYNWNNGPGIRIHRAELDEIIAETHLKWEIEELRKSCFLK